MTDYQLSRDAVLVVQAAHAYRTDQPLYARSLLAECDDAETTAVELVGILMQERADLLDKQSARSS